MSVETAREDPMIERFLSVCEENSWEDAETLKSDKEVWLKRAVGYTMFYAIPNDKEAFEFTRYKNRTQNGCYMFEEAKLQVKHVNGREEVIVDIAR